MKVLFENITPDEILKFNKENKMKVGYVYKVSFGQITLQQSFDMNILFDNSIKEYFSPTYYMAKSIKDKTPDKLVIKFD